MIRELIFFKEDICRQSVIFTHPAMVFFTFFLAIFSKACVAADIGSGGNCWIRRKNIMRRMKRRTKKKRRVLCSISHYRSFDLNLSSSCPT